MKQIYIFLIALFLVNGAMAQWFPQYSGIAKNLNSVFFTDTITGYAVGDTGTILKTSDGGTNWSILNSGIYEDLLSVYFTDANTGYTVGNDSVIYKTIDGGQNWTGLSAGISVYLNSVCFTGTDTGYVTGNFYVPNTIKHYVLKTTNGGNLWTISHYGSGPDGGGPFLKSIHFPNAITGYAVGEQGQLPYPYLLKTTDGGTIWINKTAGYDHFLSRSVYFINPDVGFIVNPLLKTTNGGTDWTMPILSDSFSLNDIYFADANIGYGVGQNYYIPPWCSIILKTLDGGINWTTQYLGTVTYTKLNSVYFVDESIGYSVGSGGAILKTTNGGGFPVGVNDNNSTSNSLKIYPNPSSNKIIIETSPISAKNQLFILNLGGQKILYQTITQPLAQVDISSLPSGIYFVKVIGENTVLTGKIIKE
jgi:photosystem II stability/assembly factor-like uncharacterized protein